MKTARLLRLIILCVSTALLCSVAALAQSMVLDLSPNADERTPLENPHKGWYHHFPDNHPDKYRIAQDEDLLEFPGMDHLYIRLAWSYLEPREGQFDWPVIDRIIEKWTSHDLGIAFRISCRETSSDRIEQQFATPRWVMDAGAKGGYYYGGKETGPDGPWEPVYGDPVFLEKLDHFLAAFAARYDSKPWLRYIDIGSIGDWGEGHAWAGSRQECGLETRLKHVDLYLKHFNKAQLIISDDYVYALTDPQERKTLHEYVIKHSIGYRDDSILVSGYISGTSDRYTVRSPEFFADSYLKHPNVFELEHYGTVKKQGNWEGLPDSQVARYGQGKKGPDYFRGALELLHATYIGYHGYAHDWRADNPELTGELLNRCGYWYFLKRASLPEALRVGADANVELAWENRGVAPAYHPFRLLLRLEGEEVVEQDFEAGNREWRPGSKDPFNQRYTLKLPGTMKPGRYELKFKLHSPLAKRDVLVALKPDLRDKAGYYRIGTVEVRQ